MIEAPSVLGLRPTGVETLPDALLKAGLATRLRARRAGRVEPPPYDDRRDPETLMLNSNGIAEYTSKLADAIGKVLQLLFEDPFEVELHPVRQPDEADQLPTVLSERVQFPLVER
jgi:hypothetical protein